MRDLRANLKELTTRGNYRTDYYVQLEWLERAIAAEDRVAALTEENERMLAQVVKMQRVIELVPEMLEYFKPVGNCTCSRCQVMGRAEQVLAELGTKDKE